MILPFRLTICGLTELKGMSSAAVTHVLSILDPAHPVPEVFGSFGEHDKLELRFDDIIEELPGKIAPQPADIEALLCFGRQMRAGLSTHLLVHCHAGVSRSTASAALLLAQAMPDWSGDGLFTVLMLQRPIIWPNLRMIELGDAALNRGGDLVAAAGRLYAYQIEGNLDLIEYFQGLGRQRELAAAFAAGALEQDDY